MTEKGSILNFGHRIDCNGVGVLRGLRHIPSKNYPKYPPWPHILREWYKTTMLERKAHTGTEQTKISHHLKLHFPLFVFVHPSAPLGDSLGPKRALMLSSYNYMVVLYHNNYLTTGKDLWRQVCSAYRWCSNGSVSISNWSYTCKSILMRSCLILSLGFWGTGIAYGLSREYVQCILLLISKWRHAMSWKTQILI